MSNSFNSTAKDCIRSVWAKRLLEFLSKETNKKLVYLGLPGENAYDVEEWIEYLDKVFAFQNDDERYPEAYENLIKRLDILEQKGLLSTYNVFNGYIEKVVTQGSDENNAIFELNEVITLYNLDFCNQIDFPIKIAIPEYPYEKDVYKFDAIKELLEIQTKIADQSKRFVLFFTIHCSYSDKKTKEVLNSQPFREYLAPKNKLLKGLGHYKNAYSLRKLVLRNLCEQFFKFNFDLHILPTIYYEGDNGTPLLFFSIIGKNGSQIDIEEIETQISFHLKKRFLTVKENDFINLYIPQITDEDDFECLNPVDFFSESEFYNTNWKI